MNAVFLHIPKTAGGYISEALSLGRMIYRSRIKKKFNQKGIINIGHQDYRMLVRKGLINREFDKSSFKFCFCRNPYDRVVSHYFWARLKHPELLSRDVSFLNFTRMFGAGASEGDWFRPQCHAIKDVKIDFVGRFERLEKDIDRLAEILGIERLPPAPPKKKWRRTSHAPYREYYNDESMKNVQMYYREDFERFGYDYNILHRESSA